MNHKDWELLATMVFCAVTLAGALLGSFILANCQTADEEQLRDLIGAIYCIVFILYFGWLGSRIANAILVIERRQAGKHNWDWSDMDELEERIRKLEEKDP